MDRDGIEARRYRGVGTEGRTCTRTRAAPHHVGEVHLHSPKRLLKLEFIPDNTGPALTAQHCTARHTVAIDLIVTAAAAAAAPTTITFTTTSTKPVRA